MCLPATCANNPLLPARSHPFHAAPRMLCIGHNHCTLYRGGGDAACARLLAWQDWPFNDGDPPPDSIIISWLTLVKSCFGDKKGSANKCECSVGVAMWWCGGLVMRRCVLEMCALEIERLQLRYIGQVKKLVGPPGAMHGGERGGSDCR